MKQTADNLQTEMKVINRNTHTVVSTSGTTMTSNSSQYIYFTFNKSQLFLNDYENYHSIKVRFRQEGTSETDANVYLINSGYSLSSKHYKTIVIGTEHGYYREVDLTELLLEENSDELAFGFVSNSSLTLHTKSSTYKPILLINTIEDDPSIKNQKFLTGQTCSKDQYGVNVRTGELSYGINLFSISNRFIPLNIDLNYTTRSLSSSNVGFPTGWKLNAHQYIYSSGNNYYYVDKQGITHEFVLSDNSVANVYYDTLKTYLVLRLYPSSTTERYVLDVDRYEKMYFNSSGYLVKITKQVSDSKTYETTFTYDTNNKLTSISNDGDYINIGYNTSTITLTHSASSKVCTLTFSSNQLTKVKGFDNIETTFTYNASRLASIQTLKKKVEFEFISTNSIVKRFKESSINGTTNNVDRSYVLDYEGSQTRVGIHPYSSYSSNAGSLYFLYHFNKEGELDRENEVKGDNLLFNKIINKEGNAYQIFTNVGKRKYCNDDKNTVQSSATLITLQPSIYNETSFVFANYKLSLTSSFLDNGGRHPKVQLIVDSNVIYEAKLDYSIIGQNQIAIPFDHSVNITSNSDIKINMLFNGGHFSITFVRFEFHSSGEQKEEVYGNIFTEGSSLTIDNVAYKKLHPITLYYDTKSKSYVTFTYEDLVKNMDNFIHARNNQSAIYDIFYNDGKLLANVSNVKYGSITQLNSKVIKGNITPEVASYGLLEVSRTDNKITNSMVFKKYGNSNKKKITITDKYRKVKSVSDDSGYSETYTYDVNGSVSNVLINNSNTYINGLQEEYKSLIVDYENNNGNVTKEKEYCDFLTIGNSYAYDTLGRVSTIHDFNNSSLARVTNTYGAYLTKCKFPITSSTSEENNLTYEGELVKTLSQTGGASVDFTYNERGDVTQIKIGGSDYCTITHTYNAAGKVETITYANNYPYTYTYTYDIYGKLVTIHKGSSLIKRFTYEDIDGVNSSLARVKKVECNFTTNGENLENITYGYNGETYDMETYREYGTNQGIEKVRTYYKTFTSDSNGLQQVFQTNAKSIKEIGTISQEIPVLEEVVSSARTEGTLRNQIFKTITYDTNKTVIEQLQEERLGRTYIQDIQMGDYSYRRTPSFKHANGHTTNFVETDKLKIGIGNTSTVKNIVYQYNNRGMISYINDGINIVYYTYDHQNRLTREMNTKLGKVIDYMYDKNGNIICKQVYSYTNGVIGSSLTENITFTYDSNNKLLTYSKGSIEHDSMGRISKFKGNNLSWIDGKLSSYKGINFYYGADGQRIYKGTPSDSSGIKINYLNDEESMFKEKRSDGITLTFIRGVSGIIGFKYDNKLYYYRKNNLGDVIELYYNGNVEAKYAYDAWGNHVVLNPNGTTNTSTSFIGNINPIRYRGYYYDVETQLFYCNSRYYSPELCRFISPDSIEYLDPQSINGLNLYAYCGNDPVNRFDPTGTFWISLLVGMAIGAAIGFATAAYSDYKEDKVWFNGQWQDYAFEVGLGAFTGAIGGGVGSLFHTSNFIAGFALSTLIGAGTQIASDAYYGNLNSSSEWSDWVLSGLKGAIVSGISYSISYGVTRLMASNAFAGIIGKNTSNNKINKALSSAGLSSKIGRDGKNVVIREIMNSDSMGVFNTLFSGWVDFVIGVLF